VPVRSRRLPELPPLPPWLPPEDPSRFDNYDLPPVVREGIAAAGFTKCTEVQSKVLPLALQGKDVAAQSQTGTGKTAAFLVTILSRLTWRGAVDRPRPRALVIAPTRELTVQIENDARLLGGPSGLTVGVAFGGVDYDRQRQALIDGVDLLIGTPGRLIDYLKQGVWSGDGVEVLVIDEADRMLDMGFIKDLRFILRRLPPYDQRLSMLFSATMSWRAQELTYEYMDLPAAVSASPEKVTAEKAEEVLYHVGRNEKAGLLLGLLEREPWSRMLIFTNMKVEAEKLERLLVYHGIKGRAITGNLEQKRRLSIMADFKSGNLTLLVATDVASRGLHIEDVTHVINWDLPQDPEDYVHRIGRTARAGASGKAISLADEQSVYHLGPIEELIGHAIPVAWHSSEDLAEVKKGWNKGRQSGKRDEGPRRRAGRPDDRKGGGGRRGRGGAGGRPRRP
jgi:ATP-dependent RNA helicase RhlB